MFPTFFCAAQLVRVSIRVTESEFFGWIRIPSNTRSRSRIFCPTPTPEVQLDHFLHHTPKLGISVEMLKFLMKFLLKQRIFAVHHDFH